MRQKNWLNLLSVMCVSCWICPALVQGSISSAEYSLLQAQFLALQTTSSLPVSGMSFDDVESAFGPRFQTSTQRYDFHRGIDVDGVEGDNIVSVFAGRFYEYVEYQAGGHTVVIEHDFAQPVTLNGTNYDHFYTYYMHLWDDGIGGNGQSTDDLLTGVTWEKLSNGNGTIVSAGQHIGEMGNSGSSGGAAYADHLHLELRVGARTSLSFQLDNLDTTTQHGFDPHINPMVLFEPLTFNVDYAPTLEMAGPVQQGADATVVYSVDDEMPLLNRFEVRVKADGGDGEVLQSHVLDYDLREGFDASTTDDLDTQLTAFPYIDPQPFGDSSDSFVAELIIPAVWLEGFDESELIEISALDIYGNELTTQFAIVPEPADAAWLFAFTVGLLALVRRGRRLPQLAGK